MSVRQEPGPEFREAEVTEAGALEDGPDALRGEAVVGDGVASIARGLLPSCSAVPALVGSPLAGPVWHEVPHQQHAAGAEALGQPHGRETRVVEVVEPAADDRQVEGPEFRARERRRIRVLARGEVALHRVHVFSRNAL